MRKICVVTGSRAEYGLLYWLLKEIQSDKELQLQLIVTGMHLSPEFGLTYKLIEKDGFVIDKKVEMLLSSDSSVGISKSIGLGVISFSESLEFLNPDIVVLLGDRFEILAAATAALIGSIPIAHIHGGEITEGAFDESIRHSITKFAYLHFVATEEYRKRVIQLGENPERVFNFGAPGLDLLSKMHWMDKKEIEEDLGVQLNHPIFLVTYHPVTLGTNNPEKPMNELLNALENFPGSTIIFTYPNSDTGGRIIIDLINSFVSKNDLSRKAYVSLGAKRYTSLMKLSDVIIGNSSSGIIEAPALKKPTVNLGDRQKGRLKANSIIDCLEEKESIISGIQKALSKEFQEVVRHTVSLYGEGNVSLRIKEKLKTSHLEKRKIFFDLNHSY